MSPPGVNVRTVRRSSDGESIIYNLAVGSVHRKLALFKVPRLDVAIVSGDSNDLLAILMSLEASDGTKHRTLIRFGARDEATTALLKPRAIADLRVPRAQRTPHWKDAGAFRLATDASTTHLITHAPISNYVAKSTLEDAFCKPSITTQLNSAMNACFQKLCSYVKCVQKNVACREEAAAVNAFCFARGSETD